MQDEASLFKVLPRVKIKKHWGLYFRFPNRNTSGILKLIEGQAVYIVISQHLHDHSS